MGILNYSPRDVRSWRSTGGTLALVILFITRVVSGAIVLVTGFTCVLASLLSLIFEHGWLHSAVWLAGCVLVLCGAFVVLLGQTHDLPASCCIMGIGSILQLLHAATIRPATSPPLPIPHTDALTDFMMVLGEALKDTSDSLSVLLMRGISIASALAAVAMIASTLLDAALVARSNTESGTESNR